MRNRIPVAGGLCAAERETPRVFNGFLLQRHHQCPNDNAGFLCELNSITKVPIFQWHDNKTTHFSDSVFGSTSSFLCQFLEENYS
jgi:hypothetical protein